MRMLYTCFRCGIGASERVAWCPGCFAFGSFGPSLSLPRRTPRELRIVAARQMLSNPTRLRSIWGLGEIPVVGRSSFLVYGPPGSGKSTFLLRVASELIRKALVLYVAAEEGASETMRQKLRRLEIVSDKLLISEAGSVDDVLQACGQLGADWAMLDSYTSGGWSVYDLARLGDADVSFGVSAHVNGDGEPYAARAVGHLVDKVFRVEAGTYKCEKNRYGSLFTGTIWQQEEVRVC